MQSLKDKHTALLVAIAALQVASTELETEMAGLDAHIASERKAGFDEGFTKGREESGEEKLYTQADVDAKLAEQAATFQSQLDAHTTEVESLKLQVSELETKLGEADAKAEEKLAAFKAEVKAALEAQQASESEGEAAFGKLLE